MATDLERLVVQLSADIKSYQNALNKANNVSNRQFKAIENRARKMNSNLDAIFSKSFRGLVAPLTGIGAALGTREILQYADAWTSAKNSLAVAGVLGSQQRLVLDELYQSAQANAAPITALTDLYGKAAQASDNLGASQEDLLKFSDGVAVALKVAGTSATQASGALTQLGQLLGQARVQAEEFNSVNEGARPILMAVANGLDAAGGSVSKLKTLVTDGKVSGQQFFQAFLKGLPTIQSMAANATQTIDQGLTKVNNAFTKYIGQSDESLGASQRLVQALNALADNFGATADIVLKVAGIIAGALVGRSIAGMIRSLGIATTSLWTFVGALRAASSANGLATAFGGLGAAAGPVGAVIGGTVVTALALFASNSDSAGVGADLFGQRLRKMGEEAEKAGNKVEEASRKVGGEAAFNAGKEVEYSVAAVNEAKAAVDNLFEAWIQVQGLSLVTDAQREELEKLKKGLDDGTISAEDAKNAIFDMAKADYNFEEAANQFKPVLDALALVSAAARQARADMASLSGGNITEGRDERSSKDPYIQARAAGNAYIAESQRRNSLSKEQLSIETEIAKIRKDAEKSGAALTDKQIRELAEANVAADKRRTEEGKKPKKPKATPKSADQKIDSDVQSVRDRIAAMQLETQLVGKSYQEQEKRRMSLELEQAALAKLRDEAIKKGQTDLSNIKISSSQRAQIDAISEAYARQADELRRVQDQQDRAEQAADEFYSTFKSSVTDAITGANSLADALKNILNKLADLALSSAFDALFKPATGGASGGAFGNIFSNIGKLIGFDDGGYTGPGGKYQPAGVVHKGEYVFDQDAVRKAGGPAALDAMRRGLKGYANGGFVSGSPLRAPSMPILRSSAASQQAQAGIADVRVFVDRDGNWQAEVERISQRNVKQGLASYDKSGAVRTARDLRQVNSRGLAK